MVIFVTGFHRAGTHSTAEYLAKKNGVPYIEEAKIGFTNYNKAVELCSLLPHGFVLQCPCLSCRSADLARLGKTIWMKRNETDLITAHKNAGIDNIAWMEMRAYRNRYPGDKIWDHLEYDGSTDVLHGFVGYFALLKKVKDYFCDKYFQQVVDVRYLEDQPFYNYESTLSKKKPLKEHEIKRLIRGFENARLCVDKAQSAS